VGVYFFEDRSADDRRKRNQRPTKENQSCCVTRGRNRRSRGLGTRSKSDSAAAIGRNIDEDDRTFGRCNSARNRCSLNGLSGVRGSGSSPELLVIVPWNPSTP